MRHCTIAILFMLVAAIATPAAETPAVKDWTVLVYLNADNNLDEFGVKDLKEMEKIGSSDQVNVVVLIDREHSGAKTFYVEKGKSRLLKDHGEIDMGNWRTLVDFGCYGVENFPSRKLLLVVWNHGSGWRSDENPLLGRGISYDDSSGNHINTPALGTALEKIAEKRGAPIDIFGMDACLMQMLEVATEVQGSVGQLVASEETEPGNGWPYTGVLKPLVANPAISAAEFARQIVTAYRNSYLAWSVLYATTQSALDMKQLDPLLTAVNDLGNLLADKLRWNSDLAWTLSETVYPAVQRFAYRDNADLVSFCKELRRAVSDREIDQAALAVQRLLTRRDGVVAISRTTGKGVSGADGLAIYLPFSRPNPAYRQLKFAGNGWYRFLKVLHESGNKETSKE